MVLDFGIITFNVVNVIASEAKQSPRKQYRLIGQLFPHNRRSPRRACALLAMTYIIELTSTHNNDIMPTQFNSPTRRSYPERRRERPCDASTTCQRVVIIRRKLKRCQFRQTDVLGDERARYSKMYCPFCSSEGAISFLKEFHNEQHFYDVTEIDVHI
jgi:hypothetical protein